MSAGGNAGAGTDFGADANVDAKVNAGEKAGRSRCRASDGSVGGCGADGGTISSGRTGDGSMGVEVMDGVGVSEDSWMLSGTWVRTAKEVVVGVGATCGRGRRGGWT